MPRLVRWRLTLGAVRSRFGCESSTKRETPLRKAVASTNGDNLYFPKNGINKFDAESLHVRVIGYLRTQRVRRIHASHIVYDSVSVARV